MAVKRANLRDCGDGRSLVYLWTKLIRPDRASAWSAKVARQIGADRLAQITPTNGRSVRLEAYCATALEAQDLVGHFGGQVRKLADEDWQPAPATARGQPLSIGARLQVTAWPDELAAHQDRHGKQVLCIPAAMAFGTGEHATTAMCLRLLAEAARRRRNQGGWEILDLGTGSGILALAAVLLGAEHAEGLDNDPNAVRTAKANARLNGIATARARFARADLLRWSPASKRWPVITANLFSELLIQLLPNVIAPALAPAGDLILSGILAKQQDDVETAIRRAGLHLSQVKRRGRWRALHCRWPDSVL